MNLEHAIAVLRPRTPWEAVDFGWQLGKRLYRPMMAAWFLVAAPLALATLAANWSHPWIAVLMLWLLRPVLDTPVLFVLSRGLFSQPSDLRALLPQLRTVLGSELAARLTLRRFDPQRSYKLPVGFLEGLRGRPRRQRAQLLVQRQGSQASELTYVCLGLELVVLLGGFGLVFLMLPEAMHPDWETFFDNASWTHPLWGRIAFALFFIAMSVVQPLYVCGGFGLYLNRRTLLEGWDIQLAFQRLASRARAALTAALVFIALAVPVLPQGALAQEPSTEVEDAAPDASWPDIQVELAVEAIDSIPWTEPSEVLPEPPGDVHGELTKILADPEFGWEEQDTVWQSRSPSRERDANFGWLGALVGQLAEILLWALALVALGFIGFWAVKSSGRIAVPQSPTKKVLPTELLGMDLRPESLPEDVPSAARALLGSGDRIGALSLLYRGALARLVRGYELELNDGATENDCIRAVRAAQGPSRWFEGLTRAWQSEAYAHRPQPVQTIEALIDEWTYLVDELSPGAGA